MPDEIETTAELIALAVLGDIVIHELAATRNGAPDPYGVDLPPEELHAPDSVDDEAAMSFRTRLDDAHLWVRCRIETCNAYGSFVADGEALFDLPAPVSSKRPNIVLEFAEQIGAPLVFPYIRAAVAALAAQLSVPASPLPILRAGDVALTHDDEPVVEEEPSEFFMHGTVMETDEDGGREQLAELFLDEETGVLTRIGGEGLTPDVDELLNFIAELPPPGEMTPEWLVRNHGAEAIRESIEAQREANGDDATDQLLAEIDAAVAHIEVQEAFSAMYAAIETLDTAITSVRTIDADPQTDGGAGVSTALLDAAEHAQASWVRLDNAMSN